MQDFDAVLLEVGEFGRYQQLVMCLLCLSACFLNPYNSFQLVFLMYTPPHQCKAPEPNNSNFNITVAECNLHHYSHLNDTFVNVEKCTEWVYSNEYFDSTIITKWNLVCDRAIDSKISLSLITSAAVIGCLAYAYIQDRWGRKVAFEINLATYILGASLSLFMPDIWSFTGVRLLSAINGMSTWNIGYVWALEYTGPSKRTTVTTVMCIVYGIGMASLSVIAWLCNTWVQMGLACSLPFLALFSYHFIIKESPRWLLTQGRTAEAIEVIQKIANSQRHKVDSGKLDEVIQSLTQTPSLDNQEQSEPCTLSNSCPREGSIQKLPQQVNGNGPGKEGTFLDLFRKPQICKKTLLVTFAWIANAVVYTSISFNTENLGGNLYLTWAILAIVEAVGCLLIMLLNKIGRIWPLSGLMVVSGVCCLLTAPSDYLSPVLVIVFALIGKLAISVTYGVLYQLAGELFPTVVRGLGIGFGSVVGDAGNILMPYIIYSAKAYKMLPMVIIGMLALLAGLLALFLPETLGRYMPETLEEAELYGKVGWSTVKGHFGRICHRTPQQIKNQHSHSYDNL